MNQRGLTLIEVVVAAAVLFGVVVAASRGVAWFAAADAGTGRRDAAASRVADELERLRGLPFCVAGTSPGQRHDLVATTFPHADPASNTASRRYLSQGDDGCPPGSFASRTIATDGTLTVVATYVASTAAGWVPVTADRLDDYDAGVRAPLPSGALRVVVAFDADGGKTPHTVSRTIVVVAPPARLCPLQPPPIEGGAT